MGSRILLAYEPTEKQRMFHSAQADEVLFGGAAGGGKSKAIVMEALLRCLEHAGTKAYLFRRTYRELEDTLLAEALASVPEELGRYHASQKEMRLINGSILRFRHCMAEKDRYLYQGAEIHWLFIDELTHFTQTIYDFLKSRLRAALHLGIRPCCRCTANPGGLGHAWVKQRFVDAGKPYIAHAQTVHSGILGETRERTVQYIPAFATDNPYISKDYIFELEQKPRALRDALLYGKWDAFEGQAFPEFRDVEAGYATRRGTHVIDAFEIPKHWTRVRSFDFGFAKPFSVGWWAVDEAGRVYRYREWYGAAGVNEGLRMSPAEIAREIARSEVVQEKGCAVRGVADPSIWDGSRGPSVAEQMEREGVYFESGDNARLAGKMQLHERLRLDAEGRPGLYVFSNCRHWIRTVPALCYSDERPEDIDTEAEDHAYDETRYFLMSRPVRAVYAQPRRRIFDPLS